MRVPYASRCLRIAKELGRDRHPLFITVMNALVPGQPTICFILETCESQGTISQGSASGSPDNSPPCEDHRKPCPSVIRSPLSSCLVRRLDVRNPEGRIDGVFPQAEVGLSPDVILVVLDFEGRQSILEASHGVRSALLERHRPRYFPKTFYCTGPLRFDHPCLSERNRGGTHPPLPNNW